MVQSPSWAADWLAASQEIPRISRNPKVHHRTHKRTQPVPILGQPNPVHIPGLAILIKERAHIIVNFEETLSRVHRKFEKRNNVLQPSIMVINYCIIIIINAQYHYIV